MKRVFKYILVYFVVFTVLFTYTFVKPAAVQAEALSTTVIIISGFLLILAGMVFYSEEDLIEAATEFYNYASSECKEYIDTAATALDEASEDYINFMVNSDFLNEAINFYWDFIEEHEVLLDAVNRICGVNITLSVPYGNSICGNSLPVLMNGGEYFYDWNEIFDYCRRNDYWNSVKSLTINGVTYNLTVYQNKFCWVFNDGTGWKFTTTKAIKDIVNAQSVFYYYNDYGSYVSNHINTNFVHIPYHATTPVDFGICLVCIGTRITTYIIAKFADGEYDIDYPYGDSYGTNKSIDEFFGGALAAEYFDVVYGKAAGGAISTSKTGADVLGGAEKSLEVSKSIDSQLGLSYGGILGYEYTGVTDLSSAYSSAYTAAALAATTYTGNYTGEMSEMSIPAVIVQKFPFCVPFDLANAFGAMSSSPKLPDLSVSVPFPGFSYKWSIDFTWFGGLVNLIRWFILVIFNIGLILITRNIIRG